jgi:anthranilate phosphoribosyltransferase
VVLLNAAAVLVVAGCAPHMREGVAVAARAIDSGAATKLVSDLAA